MSAEYTITKEKILKMAEACPTAKAVLKAGFPDAFDGKWEEVPLSCLYLVGPWGNEPESLFALSDKWGRVPFSIYWATEKNLGPGYRKDFKFEDGKIWRRTK